MSPRPYQLGRRQAEIDEGRGRILDAARALLAGASSYRAFTVDAVAKRADVARATVYYQFGSKTGLLEAVCDDLAASGHMEDMAEVFTAAEPTEALHLLVAVFARFWDADRVVMRRLRALAVLDPDVGSVIAARDDRRRQALAVLVERLTDGSGAARADARETVVAALVALTSFETFDALAGAKRAATDAVATVTSLVGAVLAANLEAPCDRSEERSPPGGEVSASRRGRTR